MASEIVVPDLSESVIEATVADWLKNEGDFVEEGEAVVVLETDKVSVEVTAEAAGTLVGISAQPGDDVQPGDVLGTLDADAAPSPSDNGKSADEPAAPAAVSAPAKPTGDGGTAIATPVAQRMATEHNVDLAQITPSGNKITKDDVQAHIDQQSAPAKPQSTQKQPAPKPAAKTSAPSPAAQNGREEERIRMSRRRRTIAERLVDAQQTAALLTTFNEVDMSAIMDLRKRRKEAFKEKYGVSLGMSSFFVKAVIGALKAFPRINAEIQENEMVLKKYYDIGIAIGAEEGLIVPVLRNADRMSFAEIEKQIRVYAKQAQEGTLSIEALMGGTFTITNGGVFGSMMSTPILNPPQVGILGLHGISERPVAIDGEVVIRPMMYTALTYDHRMVDGREAVQFLVRVKDLIEDPETLLIEG
jgi:2-oxoglutarate dehydrogenase E2 component (dihydrolipoamide succinyltransferase)